VKHFPYSYLWNNIVQSHIQLKNHIKSNSFSILIISNATVVFINVPIDSHYDETRSYIFIKNCSSFSTYFCKIFPIPVMNFHNKLLALRWWLNHWLSLDDDCQIWILYVPYNENVARFKMKSLIEISCIYALYRIDYWNELIHQFHTDWRTSLCLIIIIMILGCSIQQRRFVGEKRRKNLHNGWQTKVKW
jgi:hypothetical protein